MPACGGRRQLAALSSHLSPRADINAGDTDSSAPADLKDHPSLVYSHPDSPLRWGAGEWEAMAQRQRAAPLLDMDAVRQRFNRQQFLRDGVLVLPGVMRAPERWQTSLRQLQGLNDAFVCSDWGAWVDWSALDADPPLQPQGLTLKQQHAALGNSQAIRSTPVPPELRQTTQHRDMAGEHLLRRHSVIPEYFPCGHDPWLMEAMTHDDMLSLHCLLFGCQPAALRFDHAQLFNRPAGHRGVTWHSHVAGGQWDVMHETRLVEGHRQHSSVRCGAVSPAEYQHQHNVVFTLLYPSGFDRGDGALKVVRGSHLYREVFNLGHYADGQSDNRLQSEWLSGKRDARGQPLQPESLDLPPGSLVCLYSHIAHAVQPRHSAAAGSSESRLGCLFCFRDGTEAHDPPNPPPASPGREVPPQWARLAADGLLPRALTELLRGEGVSFFGAPYFGVGEPAAKMEGVEGKFYA